MFGLEVVGIELKEQLGRRADGRNPFPGSTGIRRRSPEQIQAPLHRLVGERHQDLFLAREVMIDRALGVFHRLGDSIHAEAVVTVLNDHRTGQFEDSPLAVLNFSLFAGECASHTDIIDNPSLFDKGSFLTFRHFPKTVRPRLGCSPGGRVWAVVGPKPVSRSL